MREEAWGGISNDTSDSGSETEGGWEKMEASKSQKNEDDMQSGSESELESRSGSLIYEHSQPATSRTSSVAPLRLPTQNASTAVKQWFSQDIFADMEEFPVSTPRLASNTSEVRLLLPGSLCANNLSPEAIGGRSQVR
jgi:hypothetical protein